MNYEFYIAEYLIHIGYDYLHCNGKRLNRSYQKVLYKGVLELQDDWESNP